MTFLCAGKWTAKHSIKLNGGGGTMSTPFFSIVVPAYNTAAYLPRCIGSLLEQSFGDFEILLINDGSTDDTAAAIDRFQAEDQRIRAKHIQHTGVGAARNGGLGMAQGEYVLFVDSDDALVPGALERIHGALESAPDMLCFGLLTRSLAGGEILGQSSVENKEVRYTSISETIDDSIRGKVIFVSACTHAYRLSTIQEHQIFFQEGLVFGEDRLFNWNYLRHCPSVAYIKDKLYIYSCDREGSGSHRFVSGMPQLLMMLQEENVSTMLALCSGSVSEEEKRRFRTSCFRLATREAWKHLKLYYPSLSKHQRTQELRNFLDIRFPEQLYMGGLRIKQRIWLSGLRCAVELRAVWPLRLLLYVESTFFRREEK